MNKKCNHVWVGISNGDGSFHDECMNCGAHGYVDFNTGQIKAKKSNVVSFSDFKRKREINNAMGSN